MAAKVPIRAVFDGSTATGLSEFQSTEFIALAYGGLGASLSIGSAGQVLKVNSGASALEFGAVETILNIDGMTDGSGITIVDADKFAISDGGTEKYVLASQIKTYVHGTGAVNITTLDIDGGTDIGAAIVDADLFIVDDGAGGTNRKTAASRIATYVLSANSIDSAQYVDGSIDLAHMSANSIDSAQYVDGSIDVAHMSANSVDSAQYVDGSIDVAHMSANSIDSAQYVDGSIDTDHLADNLVTLAKMAGLARGKIIYGDSSGDPAVLTVGSSGQVLKSDGTDISWGASPAAISSYTNSTNNRVITSVDSSTINSEANLTFDGSILAVTGNVTASGTVEPAGDTASGDNAAIGYTSAEGLILTGQGSTSDVTIKNDADATVISIPTGTTNVTVVGELDAATLDISGNADIDGTLEADAYTVDGTALNEYISDTVGAMVGSNTETGITVTYQDGDNTLDFVVGTLNQDTTGTAAKVTVTDSTANTNFPVVFQDESNALLDDTGALRYNPSTGTLLVPNLNVAGTTTQVDTVTMNAENAIVFEGATADSSETTLTIVDPTSDRTQYLINQTGYIPLLAASTTTAITSTPAELNLLDGSSANSVVNSKAVIYGSSGELAGTLSTANSVDSAQYVDGSIDTDHLAADVITGAKIADDAIDSEHYTDGSIDNAHIADDAIDSEHYAAGSIDTAHIADDQITLAKMAGLARGKIIYGNSSGNPTALAVGSADQILTADGTDLSWSDPTAGGAGYFLGGASGATGDTTNGLEDIFRVNSETVDNSCTIASSTNANATGPLTISSGVTVTVAGRLVIL